MFHPVYTYINKQWLTSQRVQFYNRFSKTEKRVYELPTLQEIKKYKDEQIEALWDEYKRILNPEQYPVDLSQKTYDQKLASIAEIREEVRLKSEQLAKENAK